MLKEKATKVITFRCTPDERERIEAFAAADERPLATFCRRAVLEKCTAMETRRATQSAGALFDQLHAQVIQLGEMIEEESNR